MGPHCSRCRCARSPAAPVLQCAGVVENVLGRVVDAFEAQMAAVLRGSAAGRLAESLPMVQLMVKEPAAALLGSPVAFFVGRNTGGWGRGRAGLMRVLAGLRIACKPAC